MKLNVAYPFFCFSQAEFQVFPSGSWKQFRLFHSQRIRKQSKRQNCDRTERTLAKPLAQSLQHALRSSDHPPPIRSRQHQDPPLRPPTNRAFLPFRRRARRRREDIASRDSVPIEVPFVLELVGYRITALHFALRASVDSLHREPTKRVFDCAELHNGRMFRIRYFCHFCEYVWG